MSINSLYPGFLKFLYTGNEHQHVAILPVLPSASASTFKLAKGDGTTYDPWTDAVDAYNLFFKPLIGSSDGIIGAELWTMATATANPVFEEAYYDAVAGTGSTAVALSELVFSYRASLGGLYRQYLMEGVFGTTTLARPPFSAGAALNMINFMIAPSTQFIVARDGSFPVGCTSVIGKVNDALRKKYFLNV